MSFDMYLFGEVDHFGKPPNGLWMETYLLAEWQKHYALHELITRKNGESSALEPVEIYLFEEHLRELLHDIEHGALTYNEGSRFSAKRDLEAFSFALEWLLSEGSGPDRNVKYAAS